MSTSYYLEDLGYVFSIGFEPKNVDSFYEFRPGVHVVRNLEGNIIYKDTFGFQENCTAHSKSSFIPSPDSQLVLKTEQQEDCSIAIKLLDLKNNFSLVQSFSLPAIDVEVIVAWSEEGDVIAQTIDGSEVQQSWKISINGSMESYSTREFESACFTPASKSHYVNEKLQIVYIDAITRVPTLMNLKDSSADVSRAYVSLSVFGCKSLDYLTNN